MSDRERAGSSLIAKRGSISAAAAVGALGFGVRDAPAAAAAGRILGRGMLAL